LDVVVGAGNVVAFDEVDPPIGVQLNDGVVIGLSFRLGGVHAIHVGVPGTDRAGDGNILGSDVGTINRQVFLNRFLGDAPHDVDAEFQAFGMYVISQRLEAHTVGGRGEFLESWCQSSVFIHGQRSSWPVVMAFRLGFVPLDVDGQIGVAAGQQVFSHRISLCFNLLFGDRGAVYIPTVPTQRRRGGKLVVGCVLLGCKTDY